LARRGLRDLSAESKLIDRRSSPLAAIGAEVLLDSFRRDQANELKDSRTLRQRRHVIVVPGKQALKLHKHLNAQETRATPVETRRADPTAAGHYTSITEFADFSRFRELRNSTC
jgi:hypothetical protein